MSRESQSPETIFGRAIEIESPAERAAFLDQSCGENAELRRELEKLLVDHFRAGDFLEHPAAQVALTVDMPQIAEEPGTAIGPYKLLEQIGEGGFGIVYMADQQAPVRRRVALKIIKPGMDTRQVLARFKAELQALSLMDHPNIARALDAGSTDSGRPYFVMELVRGVPITDYCDQNNLPVHARLDLFVQVCHAVQHAHQKGIIHRDIKPSNVLVTLHDGRPVPKVIDFGVAKAIDRQLTPETLFTRFAEMIGTPLYMSPEQAEMTGLDIDTRADIYSLGVLLYELLTGSTPFDKDRLRKVAFDEIRRIIREEDPPKPSSRISTLDDTRAAVAAHRHADPHRLGQLVRGDLDWIVMKALEKDRTHRYDTASNFAADVLRYLSHRPVEACPPSSAYRFRKFARRNRVAITTVAVVLIALLLGTVVSSMQAVRATRAERLAEARLQKESEARNEADVARQTAEQARQAEAAQRQIAEKMRNQAEAHFRQARQAVDDMYTQVAQKWLAHQPRMEPTQREFLKKALSFYRQFSEKSSPEPAVRFEAAKAYSRVGEIQHKLGEAAEAEKAYSQAILLLQRLVDEFPDDAEYRREWADSLHRLAVLVGDTGRHTEEEKLHRRALVLQRKMVGEFPKEHTYRRDLARGLYTLASTNHEVWSGHDKEQREVIVEAVALQKKLVAEVPSEPEYRAELAASLMKLGSLRESAALLEKLVADFPGNPAHRDALGDAYFGLAWTLPPTDAEKEKRYHQAIAVKEKLLADFPSVDNYRSDVAQYHHRLGEMLAGAGKVKEAETAYRQGLAIGEPLLAIPKIDYFRVRQAEAYDALGDLLTTSNRFAEAEKEYRRALAVLENWLAEDPKSPSRLVAVATERLKLRSLLAKANRPEAAAAAYNRASAEFSKAIELDPKNAGSLRARADTYIRLKQWDKAIADYSKAIALEPTNGGLLWNRALAYRALKQGDKAIADCSKAIELEPKNGGLWGNRAIVYMELNQWDKAIADCSKGIELEPTNGGLFINRANIYRQLKQWDKAIADYSKVIELEPTNGWFVVGRANVYSQLKQWDKALADYSEAIKLDPKNSWARRSRAYAYSQLKQWDKAIAEYSKAIELDPKDVWSLADRANFYRELKQWDKALADYSKVIKLDPKNVRPLWERANVYGQLKQSDKAIADWSKAIELEPKNTWALGNRANLYGQLKQWDKAIADWSKVVELEPKNASANNTCAWFLATNAEARLQHPDRAVELAKKAVDLAPKEGMFWNTLGVAHYGAGDWKAATAALTKSDELLKGNELSFNAFFLAMAHWQLGNKAEARKWYDQAVGWMEKNKPQDVELRRFRAETEELLGSNQTSKTSAAKSPPKEGKPAK